MYLATAFGFIIGLVVNYLLSLLFVFKKNTEKGKHWKAFFLFAVIGMIGLVLTELGMWLGVEILAIHYLFVKVIVTLLVLLWNYLGRKFFIFT